MTWTIIIGLIVLGLLLVLLEIFLLPGLIAGIIGGLIVIFAIIKAYIDHGATAGTITLIATIAAFVLLMIMLFQSKTWRKLTLHDAIDSKVNIIKEDSIKVGDIGKSISRISPMGKALFNNEYFEVASNVNFIDENKAIIIVKIEGNKIFVKEYIFEQEQKNM